MPTTYYISPSGNNQNNGQQRDTAFRTLSRAVERLQPGDTAILLEGEYRIEDELNALKRWEVTNLHGTRTAPITIKGEFNPRGDRPSTFTGVFSEYLQPNSSSPNWVLMEELSGPNRNIYRSRHTHFLFQNASGGKKSFEIRGWLNEDFSLITYREDDWDAFASDNLMHSHISRPGTNNFQEFVPNYAGPGIFIAPVRPEERDEVGRDSLEVYLYARLDPTPTMRFLNEEMRLRLNLNPDPNTHALRIGRLGDAMSIFNTSWLRLEDLRFYWPGRLYLDDHKNFPSPQNTVIKNCLFKGFLTNGSALVTSETQSYGVQFLELKISGGYPPWVYWTDTKHGASNGYASTLHGSCINLLGPRSAENVPASRTLVRNCYLEQAFFGIAITYYRHDVEIDACSFHHIHDDAVTISSGNHNINVHHNLILRSYAGISVVSGKNPTSNVTAGKVWVHHNIICPWRIAVGRKRFTGRVEDDVFNHNYANKYIGKEGNRLELPEVYRDTVGGFQANRPFSQHGNNPEAWNVYNNTLVVEGQHGSGAMQNHPQAQAPSMFFNNIFVQRYARGFYYRSIDTGLSPTAPGRKVADGNLVWRVSPPDPENRSDRSWMLTMTINGQQDTWFAGFSDFRASAHFEESKRYHDLRNPDYGYQAENYGDAQRGLDANSRWANPQLDLAALDELHAMKNYLQDYELLPLNPVFMRPAVDSPAAQRTILLDELTLAADWPERDSVYIGAKAPLVASDRPGCLGQIFRKRSK